METNGANNGINNTLEIDKLRQMACGCIFSLSPQQFSLLASAIGVAMTHGLNLNEQNSIGNFIVSVGQSILTAAAAGAGQSKVKEDGQQNQRIQKQLQTLKSQLASLEEDICKNGRDY